MFCRTVKLLSFKLLNTYKRHTVCLNNLHFYKYCTFSNFDKNSIENYVKKLEAEYKNISERKNLDTNKENRLKELIPVIHIIDKRTHLLEQLKTLNDLLNENDEDMKKLAEEEKQSYEEKISTIEQDLLQALIPQDPQDFCDAIVLEINAGVGGQEAMLFAQELFDMYCNFAEYKGWSCDIAEFNTTDIGGLRHASVLISGDEAFRYFKYEAGVHRVQRIPATEKSGRVHTSTVSVVALPQPRDIDIKINSSDLRIETKRASGAGGQHVNTTDSAVRIVHLPTGIAVECQVDRSQIKNRQIAMQRIKAMLYEQQLNAQIAESEATRKSQVRSNYRNEKIRTYNFSQDRITDHRLQSSNLHNLKAFLLGGQQLEFLINKLNSTFQYEKFKSILMSVNNEDRTNKN